MPLYPIETQRLYQQVADQIAALIRSGEFAPGSRLPAERDLARLLGVSRPVVREAMVTLELVGLVDVRVGSGAYVRPPTPSLEAEGLARAMADVGPSPSELIHARMLIEGEIAAAAAIAASEEQLVGIGETLDLMQQVLQNHADPLETDRLFHTRIAAATGNSVLTPIVEGLWANVFSPVFDALSRKAGLATNHGATLRAHTRIFQALQARDPDAARAAMRAHLSEVEGWMFKDEPTA